MAEDPRFLLHFKTKAKFDEKLADGTISANRHLCFINNEGLIWCRGKYYADSTKLDNLTSIYNGWSISQSNGSTITITLTGKQWDDSSRTWKDISKALTLNSATTSVAGLMSASDKLKLDRVTGTNYSIDQPTANATDRVVRIQGINPNGNTAVSSQVTIPSATTSVAGLLSASDKTALDNTIEGPASATDNHIVVFNGTSGKVAKDSGRVIGNADGNVPLNNGTLNTNLNADLLDGKQLSEITSEIQSGNSASATKLQTARNINGTAFDGTKDITTAKWGTSRQIQLTGSVTGSTNTDGSSNISINTIETPIATAVSSVQNIPTTYQIVIASISSSQTLTFASFDNYNREIHVIIRNTGSSDITVTLSSSYVLGGDAELLIEAGKYGEANCVRANGTTFVRGIGS